MVIVALASALLKITIHTYMVKLHSALLFSRMSVSWICFGLVFISIGQFMFHVTLPCLLELFNYRLLRVHLPIGASGAGEIRFHCHPHAQIKSAPDTTSFDLGRVRFFWQGIVDKVSCILTNNNQLLETLQFSLVCVTCCPIFIVEPNSARQGTIFLFPVCELSGGNMSTSSSMHISMLTIQIIYYNKNQISGLPSLDFHQEKTNKDHVMCAPQPADQHYMRWNNLMYYQKKTHIIAKILSKRCNIDTSSVQIYKSDAILIQSCCVCNLQLKVTWTDLFSLYDIIFLTKISFETPFSWKSTIICWLSSMISRDLSNYIHKSWYMQRNHSHWLYHVLAPFTFFSYPASISLSLKSHHFFSLDAQSLETASLSKIIQM
ncbi:hypothetical protein VP01_266g1 [Puccinia sorghi]|uniref:Uncharacterized protein n=1 Tax=Puccinia sorghi TaxID=27349 RepID=A0A0L6V3X5_9BASI|nr:hypothetical protein VP01_266g1 [Puccinia sorghi]